MVADYFYHAACCCCLVTKSCPTLCNAMDCGPPAGKNTGVSCHFLLWGSSQPRDQIRVFCVLCIGRWILHHWATREALLNWGFVRDLILKVLCINNSTRVLAVFPQDNWKNSLSNNILWSLLLSWNPGWSKALCHTCINVFTILKERGMGSTGEPKNSYDLFFFL